MSELDYTEDELSELEDTIEETSNGSITVESVVAPDALVLSDGDEMIRISFGAQVYQILVEADGYTNNIHTTGRRRFDAMKIALEEIGTEYASGNTDFHKLSLSL